jgi:hypothetical protein
MASLKYNLRTLTFNHLKCAVVGGPDMVAYTCNSATQEAEVGGS